MVACCALFFKCTFRILMLLMLLLLLLHLLNSRMTLGEAFNANKGLFPPIARGRIIALLIELRELCLIFVIDLIFHLLNGLERALFLCVLIKKSLHMSRSLMTTAAAITSVVRIAARTNINGLHLRTAIYSLRFIIFLLFFYNFLRVSAFVCI